MEHNPRDGVTIVLGARGKPRRAGWPAVGRTGTGGHRRAARSASSVETTHVSRRNLRTRWDGGGRRFFLGVWANGGATGTLRSGRPNPVPRSSVIFFVLSPSLPGPGRREGGGWRLEAGGGQRKRAFMHWGGLRARRGVFFSAILTRRWRKHRDAEGREERERERERERELISTSEGRAGEGTYLEHQDYRNVALHARPSCARSFENPSRVCTVFLPCEPSSDVLPHLSLNEGFFSYQSFCYMSLYMSIYACACGAGTGVMTRMRGY
jgi:hypothetical protein